MTARVGHSFLGGLRWQGGCAFWPLERMVITPEALKFGPAAGVVRYVAPRYELDTASLVCAERISRVGLFPAPGVRLVQRHEPAVIFWTLRPRRVLGAMEEGGIAVRPAGHIAPFWGTERHGRGKQT